MSIKDKTVLIIEDVPDQALLAKKILENVGLEVHTAPSVDSAIEALAFLSPHLILIDLEMPIKSGFDFLEYRNEKSSLKDVPIIVTSGLQTHDSIYKAIALRASDYLIKPYAAAKLLQKVRKQLKDTVFKSYDFKSDEFSAIVASVTASVTHVGDAGFTIESPIKIAAKSRVYFATENLEFLEDNNGFFVSSNQTSERAPSGNYASHIRIAGLAKPLKKNQRKK